MMHKKKSGIMVSEMADIHNYIYFLYDICVATFIQHKLIIYHTGFQTGGCGP